MGSAFDDLGGIAPQQLFEGFLARAVHGERLTLAVVEIEPHAVLPEHDHGNEQFGLILRGTASFRVGDETRELAPGDIWRIPSGTALARRRPRGRRGDRRLLATAGRLARPRDAGASPAPLACLDGAARGPGVCGEDEWRGRQHLAAALA